MVTDLAQDFYDNVDIPCPHCASLDVTIHAFTNDDHVHVTEGRCANCQSNWLLA